MSLLEGLGGNTDLVRLIISCLNFEGLLVVRELDSAFHQLAREVVQSVSWLSKPDNRQALHLEIWREGSYISQVFSHTALADVFCVSAQGHVLASGGRDCLARLWNLQTTQHQTLPHTSPVRCVALHGEHVATGCEAGVVRLWSVNTGTCGFQVRGHLQWVTCLKWLIADDTVSEPGLLSTGLDRRLCRWQTSSGKLVCTQKVSHRRAIQALDCSGHIAASGSDDGAIKVRMPPLTVAVVVRQETRTACCYISSLAMLSVAYQPHGSGLQSRHRLSHGQAT